jgi:hypothetical protein
MRLGRMIAIAIVAAAVVAAATMYKTASMDQAAIWLALKSCEAEVFRRFPDTKDIILGQPQPRETAIVDGCMADRGFTSALNCQTLIPRQFNVNCYYRPRTSIWDAIWHRDLFSEIKRD